MTFIWPPMLFTLLIVPVIVAAYLRLQRRRSLAASSAGLVGGQPAKRQSPGFRRHLPPLFFLTGLVILLIALARPQAPIKLPRVDGTVMLVMDVSASMGATDAEPSRLEAAKAAAREFVLSQPETVQIGIVSFSGSGFTVQSPTNDTNTLLNAIARLEPTSGTSLGQGIVSALHTIAVDAGLVTGELPAGGDAIPTPRAGENTEPSPLRDEAVLAQLPEGIYPASVIVLLSDGENNQSIEPLRAAQAAAERGVRVDALGFGTAAGAILELDGFSVHTALDEATLQQITETAGGTYYPTQGAQDLEQVYASLTPQLVIKPETMEITSVLAGASILILLAGSLFSMVWFNRLP
jgi:Ca-activated chloride channel family protein